MSETLYHKFLFGEWIKTSEEISLQEYVRLECPDCHKYFGGNHQGRGVFGGRCCHCKTRKEYRREVNYRERSGRYNTYLTESEYLALIIQKPLIRGKGSKMKLMSLLALSWIVGYALYLFDLAPIKLEWLWGVLFVVAMIYLSKAAYWLFVVAGIGGIYLLGKKLLK